MFKYLSLIFMVLSLSAQSAVDPTRPERIQEKASSVEKTELKLQSIMIRNNEPLAMIDGKIYREGDRVSGSRIVKIENWRVLLTDNQGRMELTINDRSVIRQGEQK
ncbi:hypothetical protein MIB92_04995 [Aestuariirhabdus sp. Z084]|uniref:hypothetical protein n=1 Tax=Aestuariirhabdus haliotis TaxID=2918751 RepID=UPI00201B36EF|nr:hypothetical protein [Aestuariirhabdus haliotis]MCL6414997.1 hypothetical protein [Aestuariirhabdus haliotis]MCL6418929.1 hypothetical protein [Aestuariirhabdus haliotis]